MLNSLYISGSGFEIRPRPIRAWLIAPLSDSSAIQAKVRTTMPVSIGVNTAIISMA